MLSSLLKKTAADELTLALDNYDKDMFIEYCRRQAENHGCIAILENLDKASALIYQKLVVKCAPSIVNIMPGHNGMDLPYPASRAAFSALDVHIPTAFVQNFTPGQLLDAYFGASYNPHRWTSEYEPGAKEVILSEIRKKVPWSQALQDLSAYADMFSLSVGELVNVWGDEIRAWWAKISDDKAWKFAAELGGMTGTEEETFDELCGMLGPKKKPKFIQSHH